MGDHWHRDLLMEMALSTSHRKAVLSADATRRLADYLAFRHFYRHSYSFFLSWIELEKLVTELEDVWHQIRRELQRFLLNLEAEG